MIVKEISSYIFNDSSCSSLSAYFQLCRENDLQNSIPSSVKGISLSATSHAVRRKLVDISLSGVLNTISSTLNPRRDSFDKGSSESFFGNALNSSDLKTPPLEPIDEDMPLTLTNSLHLQESPCVSAYHSPSLSPEWTLDDNDSTETCKKNYRRMSVSTITPFVLHGGIGDGGTPDVDVIECSSAQPSFVYESVRTSWLCDGVGPALLLVELVPLHARRPPVRDAESLAVSLGTDSPVYRARGRVALLLGTRV